MIAFAGCATLMLAASLLWLLRPLKVAAGAQSLKRSPTGKVLAILVPCTAIALYARLGNLDAIVPPPVEANRAMAEQMVARLAARLREAPDDLRGWRTLARSYHQLGRERESTEAYRRLVDLQPDDPDAWVDLAEASAAMQGGRYTGKPVEQVRRALDLDSDHARALAIAANEAVERNDAAAAITFWERLIARTPPGSPIALAIESNLEQARRELDVQGAPTPAPR